MRFINFSDLILNNYHLSMISDFYNAGIDEVVNYPDHLKPLVRDTFLSIPSSKFSNLISDYTSFLSSSTPCLVNLSVKDPEILYHLITSVSSLDQPIRLFKIITSLNTIFPYN